MCHEEARESPPLAPPLDAGLMRMYAHLPLPPGFVAAAQSVHAAASRVYARQDAEAERQRQLDRDFRRQLAQAWPELAAVSSCIDEANAMWRSLENSIFAEKMPPFASSGSLDFEISEPLPEQVLGARPKTHQREGITKDGRRGQAKARRRMAAQSRRRNRRMRV